MHKRPRRKDALSMLLIIMGMAATTVFLLMSLLPQHDVHPQDHPLSGMFSSGWGRDRSTPRYFMVFSTSCSDFQNWQSVFFFHSAWKVRQPGNVTRLVSGCTPAQIKALQKEHQEKIAPISDRFHLHITPDYGVKDNQKYWNKPHGLLDWMEQVLGYPNKAFQYNNDIIIIVDPDMMLLRPITHDFSQYHQPWVGDFEFRQVSRGHPIAQQYGFGARWLTSLKGNLSYVVGPNSPALKITHKEAEKYYPAGPPYVSTAQDMYDLAKHWVKFLPRVHEIFPEFMAEMHAYSVAAAHLQLPHQLNEGFMVSDIKGGSGKDREGFSFLDNVTRENACVPHIPRDRLPLVLHYCQRYSLGRWFFSKYKLIENFFDCDAPLLREPPRNLGEIYDWYIFPNGVEVNDYSDPSKYLHIVQHAWMLCTVVFSLNHVATEIKTKHCGPDANFSKMFQFHDPSNFQAMIDDPTNPFLANRTKIGSPGKNT